VYRESLVIANAVRVEAVPRGPIGSFLDFGHTGL
jgi:hypothetical protein